MAIKKVIGVEEFTKACNDLYELFSEENEKYGHQFVKINAQSIIKSWGHASILNGPMHVWVAFEEERAVGILMFIDSINTVFGERLFTEYMWACANPKYSFSLLRQALKFAKNKNIKYATLSLVVNHPKSDKLKNIYEKMGFKKDSETYIKKL